MEDLMQDDEEFVKAQGSLAEEAMTQEEMENTFRRYVEKLDVLPSVLYLRVIQLSGTLKDANFKNENIVHSCSKVMGFFFAVAKYGVYF